MLECKNEIVHLRSAESQNSKSSTWRRRIYLIIRLWDSFQERIRPQEITGTHPLRDPQELIQPSQRLKAGNTNLRPLREEGLSETPSQPTPLRNVVSHCCMENTSLLLVRTVLIREHTRSYIGAEILNHERSCRLNVHSALMTRRLQESLHYYSRIVCLHVCNLAAEHNHREPTGT